MKLWQGMVLSLLFGASGATFAAEAVQEYKPANDFVAPIYLYSAAHPIWVERAWPQSEWIADFGFGYHPRDNSTSTRGAILTQRLGFEYGLEKVASLSLALPAAGLIGNGSTYGVGNVVMNIKGLLWHSEQKALALGLRQTLPTAGIRSRMGANSRRFVDYLKGTMTSSPYLAGSVRQGQLNLMADVGTDLVVFTKDNYKYLFFGATNADRVEAMLFYDVGLEILLQDHFSALVECGGFSTLSLSNNESQVFAAPSFRYTDKDMSFGVGVEVPVTDFNDALRFLTHVDFRVFF